MRAQGFKRGENPHDQLDIGSERPSLYPKDYEDLPEDVKKIANENARQYKKDNYTIYSRTILDEPDLFEPDYDELIELFGDDYATMYNFNKTIIEFRNRDDFNFEVRSYPHRRYINVSRSMRILDEEKFMIWLGIPQEDINNHIRFTIGPDYIEFDHDWLDEEKDEYISYDRNAADAANDKFEEHCENILIKIEKNIAWEYSDEGVQDLLEDFADWWKFDKNGDIVEDPFNESVSFKRGENPQEKLRLGKYRSFEKGNNIKLLENIWWLSDHELAKRKTENASTWYNIEELSEFGTIDYILYEIKTAQWNKGDILTYDGKGKFASSPYGTYINENWLRYHPESWERIEDTTNESISFKRGGDSYKKLRIGDSALWPKEYDDLDDDIKELALDSVRDRINDRLQHYDDRAEWIADNDYILEPPHAELEKMFGKDFYDKLNPNTKYKDEPMIGNNSQNLYFSLDRDYYINFENAIEINNEYYFLLWLGIPEKYHENAYYTIKKDSIEFEPNDQIDGWTKDEEEYIDAAIDKFAEYANNVLKRIQANYDWYDTDEGIESEIEGHEEWRFTEEGKIVEDMDESLNEFKRGQNPYNKLGIGLKDKIEKWMTREMPQIDFTVNSNMQLEVSWSDLSNELAYHSKLPLFININLVPHIDNSNFYDNDDNRSYYKSGLNYIFIMRHVDIDNMKDGSYPKLFFRLIELSETNKKNIDKELINIFQEFGKDAFTINGYAKRILNSYESLYIKFVKLNRDEQTLMEDDLFNTYAFISYDEYKETTIDGEDYHKKIMGIENLIKIDKYDTGSLANVGMMRMRARTVENGKTWMVRIPKYMADKDNYYNDAIDDKFRAYIDKEKFRI